MAKTNLNEMHQMADPWLSFEFELIIPYIPGETVRAGPIVGAPNNAGRGIKIDVETGNLAPRVAEVPFPGDLVGPFVVGRPGSVRWADQAQDILLRAFSMTMPAKCWWSSTSSIRFRRP